jgi:hypothetical protein
MAGALEGRQADRSRQNMLFLNEVFLPIKWPAYFSKTKGCKVWHLCPEEVYLAEADCVPLGRHGWNI